MNLTIKTWLDYAGDRKITSFLPDVILHAPNSHDRGCITFHQFAHKIQVLVMDRNESTTKMQPRTLFVSMNRYYGKWY